MHALRAAFSSIALAAGCFAPARLDATPAWRPVLEESGFTPGGGDLSVTLSARAERSDVGSGMSGFVALAVPLDRLAAPRKLAASVDERPDDDARNQTPDDAPPGEGERTSPETPEEPAISAPVLAHLARAAVQAALRANDVSLRRSELEGLATRARASAALPELRFRAAHSNDQSLRLAPTLEDPDRYTLDGGNDLMLEASVTWRLNRLVFADEEIAVERLVLERERNTERLSPASSNGYSPGTARSPESRVPTRKPARGSSSNASKQRSSSMPHRRLVRQRSRTLSFAAPDVC